ncbi:NEL-type E3 ubiquitin ligase domain-containing protein [Pseudomonas sp. W22_MBD1_FP4]|uniref:NEL-type E3 ubiquitin ligase domain-containing protein n=1 Tax=Pseudomonas sp. W22_MBD1_FP4 TaxID=3240272 RepID=UPI003F9CA1D2
MTDPATPDIEEDQGPHVTVIRDNTPGWYTDAVDARKTELTAVGLRIPDWYKQAQAPAKERLKKVHERSRRSLNQLDQLLGSLQNPADYAEPLLVAAIEKTFGKRLDVRQVFYARKMANTTCNPGPAELEPDSEHALAPEFYFYKGLSLLEAALNNFTASEATAPVCGDCHLITCYNFHSYRVRVIHSVWSVQAQKLDIDAYRFAQLCRELDLGKSYFEHVRTTINAHINAVPEAPPGKLYSTLITSHRNQLELAAEIALMKADIDPSQHALIKQILIDPAGRKWAGDDVAFCRFRLLGLELDSILIIGPRVMEQYLVNSEIVPRPCMVYIPGDPLYPLKAYDNVGAFTEALTLRLCRAQYRTFFSQFVPLAEQNDFFAKLKMLLDPEEGYSFSNDFDASKRTPVQRQGDYGKVWKDVWYDSALQRVRSIMNNASAGAVSTDDITTRTYNAWLWSWGSRALDILNLAAFVVPVLGEVMLVVGAIQMAREVCEGLESWSDGDTHQAWAHLSAVALNVAGLAVPKALTVLKDTALVRRLVHVQMGGRPRLYDFSPGAYKHQVTLPAGLVPQSDGLYPHEGRLYLPAAGGGHYEVQAARGRNAFTLIHPEGDTRYAPRIRHNGEGAWVHEFEQPLSWDRTTLLRRMGPRVERLSDDQLEQLRLISGVSDDELRRIYVEQQLPPPIFSETLRRFELAGKHQAFIDQLSSDDPQVFGRVDATLQLKLLMDNGLWPKSRVLVIFDAEGNLTWRSDRVRTRSQVVKLDAEQTDSGMLLPAFLKQLSEPEIRQLLDEEAVLHDLRTRLDFGGLTDEEGDPIPRPASREDLEAKAQLMMPAQRTPEARALRYRDRLLEVAKNTQSKLYREEVLAGDRPSNTHAQLIQDSFPGLPRLAAEELANHASPEELVHLDSTSRLPLRLAEEARCYLQKARVMRAHTDMLFDSELTMDGVHLALHKLAALPGRLDGVGIELRAGTYDGPVLDRIGRADAPRQRRLVRVSMKEWAVYREPQVASYHRADKDAFYSALLVATEDQGLDMPRIRESTPTLKAQITTQPLSEQASRQALRLQAFKPGFKSPMRLADGRIGYPLSPVGGAQQWPSVCVMKAMMLYPSKSIEAVVEMLGLQGRGSAALVARLNQLEQEFAQLDRELVAWQQQGEPGYRSARRRVSATVRYAWQRESATAFAADGTSIGHVLDLSGEVIDELPQLSANMDHVGRLTLRRMGLSDSSLPFLQSFGGLRWLDMRENNLTQLPEFANAGVGLTKLNLSRNDIRLTEQSRARLEGMHGLKILNLSGNRNLGWTADVRNMRSLNQLYLSDTGTTRFPAGVEQLTQLARIDLHTNRLTTLPEYAFQHLERISVHDNPFSEATRVRLPGEFPVNQAQWADHVTADEARVLWLADTPTALQAERGILWDDLSASADSAPFFTVLADTTRSAEYASSNTRAALAARVWDMLEAAQQSQDIRETLFSTADDRVTCGDGTTVEFMNLERELIGARALVQAGDAHAEGALISTAKKLFRLHLVDTLAQRDVEARGPGFTEQVEVILAYRVGLADRLDLPVKSRGMLFPQQANVSPAALDQAYTQVLAHERMVADESAFFAERRFWQQHLRTRYPQELEALTAPGTALNRAKGEALEAVSDWQALEDSAPDRAQWQATHTELVDNLMTVLGKPREEILVDGAMQSAFYIEQFNLLRVAQWEQEEQAMRTLTRSVLNNAAAEQGTEV